MSSSSQPQTSAGTDNGNAMDSSEQSACCARCPLALHGATVSYAESTGGGSMVFQAPDPELEELRARVRELAEYHNREQKKLAMMTMPHEARAVATDSGARLEITTPVNNDLNALKREIENEVQWMQSGRCELARAQCSCQEQNSTPLSGSSPTQAPTDAEATRPLPAPSTAP